jgi:hypothetical protein
LRCYEADPCSSIRLRKLIEIRIAEPNARSAKLTKYMTASGPHPIDDRSLVTTAVTPFPSAIESK